MLPGAQPALFGLINCPEDALELIKFQISLRSSSSRLALVVDSGGLRQHRGGAGRVNYAMVPLILTLSL